MIFFIKSNCNYIHMNTFWSIALIVLGILILIITINDGRKKKTELTTSYIMHLKGYIGGIIFIIIGLIKFFLSINT